MRILILVLLLAGCKGQPGPTVAEQTAYMQAQIESTLIRMKCEAKCDMQMPMPGTRVGALQQPTNGYDAIVSLGNNTVQIIPWLATWGIVTKGYDTIEQVTRNSGSTSTTNNTTTTTTGDTSGDTIDSSNSGNTSSADVATTTSTTSSGDSIGGDQAGGNVDKSTVTTTTSYSNANNPSTITNPPAAVTP